MYELWKDEDNDNNYFIKSPHRDKGYWSDLDKVVEDLDLLGDDALENGNYPDLIFSGTLQEIKTHINEIKLLELLEI